MEIYSGNGIGNCECRSKRNTPLVIECQCPDDGGNRKISSVNLSEFFSPSNTSFLVTSEQISVSLFNPGCLRKTSCCIEQKLMQVLTTVPDEQLKYENGTFKCFGASGKTEDVSYRLPGRSGEGGGEKLGLESNMILKRGQRG